MSTDTKAIIGTIVAAAVSLGGLLAVQFAGVNTRIDDVNIRIDDLRAELIDRIDAVKADLTAEIATVRADLTAEIATVRAEVGVVREDVRRLDDRLRAVEIAFGQVDQRLETLERLHLPGPDAGG